MFVAHAATIAEAWLAVRERGPAVGVELTGWASDRAGWQEWEPPAGLYGDAGRSKRLTPDAVLHARVAHAGVAGDAVAFLEIDLATMTQTQLREKLSRYQGYAAAGAWRGTFPHCPPMLLLTTTPARATTYIRGARRTLTGGRGPAGYRGADPDADRLVVAACGLVRDPGRAVTEAVWLLDDEATAEVSLAELLAGRVTAQRHAAAAAAAAKRRQVVLERQGALDEIGRRQVWDLARLLDDPEAAEALGLLVDDPDRFLTDEEQLALAVIAWWGPRRARRPTGPAPRVLVDELRDRYTRLWAADARAVLGARAHIDAGDPQLAAIAASLGAGRLLHHREREHLAGTPADRGRLVAGELAGHIARRDADVARHHAALGWRARRRTTPAELADAYDARHLLVCTMCAMPAVRADHAQRIHGAKEGRRCQHCAAGELVDPADLSGPVPTLTERLAQLRERLRTGRPAP